MYWIALKMLFGDRMKLFTLVAGLTFSVLLISQQGSIFCGLMRRFATSIENANVPIWVMDPANRFIDDVKPLLDTDLPRIRSIEGVEWAMPYLQRLTQIQLPSGTSENVQLMGYDAQSLVGLSQTLVAGDLNDLNTPDAVVVDKRGLKKLGYPKIGDTFELNDHRARIVAVVEVQSGFQSLPIVMTTYDRALTYLPNQRKLLSYVLVKPKPGVTIETLTQRIHRETGLKALSSREFQWLTIGYFMKNTGIPINFGTTVLLGVFVGAAIAAQTFYTFTIENIKQFGTFKAMGTSSRTLIGMILLQALTVGLIGYGLGVGGMALFGSIVPGNSELSFYTPYPLLIIAFIAVVFVCMFSSLFSIWRVVRLEPSIVFRG